MKIRVFSTSCEVLSCLMVLCSFATVTGMPLQDVSMHPYVIKASSEWIPLEYRRDIEPGSAIDFSLMGFTDAPAGKYGWLRNAQGHFEFEKRPGRPVRFYGVNLCFSANFPDHALADILITRFKRLGYNALRIHHHDADTVHGSKDGLTLNQARMDRLDYLLATGIKEGFYVTTDLYVSRASEIKWRHIGVDRDGRVGMQLFKALCAVYEPAFQNWAAYAKNFLLHRNAYTGRCYIDEPALSLISLVNEGDFAMGWHNGIREDTRILASWKRWLDSKREKDPSFAKGVDCESLPRSYWDKSISGIVHQWVGDLEVKMVARMKAYLRNMGCKALISNDNCGNHYTARNGMAHDYDYIDDHFYVDHPRFIKKNWQLPSRCPNRNPLIGKHPIVPVDKDFPIVKGKPFVITEWNFSGPGRYRGVGGLLMGATASIRDWDGLWRFAYAHSCEGLGDVDLRRPGYFDLASDPLSQACERAGICLFLRGDIERDDISSLRIDREFGSFTVDSPCTCGGFTPKGCIDTDVLKADVLGAPATVWASSLDGKPILDSCRILLTHLTDIQGEGVEFSDESMTVLLKWGGRPLVRNGTAAVSLRLNNPNCYNVYEISTNGKRRRQISAVDENGCLLFTVTVAGPDGARILYEITQ